MARLLRSCIRDLSVFVNSIIQKSGRWPPPPGFVPCIAGTESTFPMAGMGWTTTDYNDDPSMSNETSSTTSKDRLSGLLGVDLSILWGVPVSKRTRATKIRRTFSLHRIFAPRRNLVACQHCGTWHEIHTICGECYKKVREETEAIKQRLLSYNPFKGELPDKEAVVVYQGETPPNKEMFGSEQRIIEIEKPRPSWFSADLKKRWGNLKPFVYNKPKE